MKTALAIPMMAAAIGASTIGMTATAQQTARYTHEQCRAAAGVLARTDGRDTAAATIALSPDCEGYRQDFAFDVTPEMERMEGVLRDNGIDYEAGLDARITQCEAHADSVMRRPVMPNEPAPVRDELVATCTANAQVALYADAILELKAADRLRYQAQRLEHEDAVTARNLRIQELEQMEEHRQQAIADAAADYETAMEDWRRRVELCESGQYRYCQQQ